MTYLPSQIKIDANLLGGTPVFRATRVPIQTLFDYLCAGQPLAEFLDDFPSVTQQQALEVLQEVRYQSKPTDSPR